MYHQYNILNLPVQPNIMYHGSPYLFDSPCCRKNARYGSNGEIIWQGEAIFASHDKRIALNYTFNHDIDTTKYTCGVDLTTEVASNEPLIISIYGDNEADTLNKLYGTGADTDSTGYLYLMNADFFEHEEGLGCMEKICKTTEKSGFLLEVVRINRRKEIDSYIEKGLIKVIFNHYSKLHQIDPAKPKIIPKPIF